MWIELYREVDVWKLPELNCVFYLRVTSWSVCWLKVSITAVTFTSLQLKFTKYNTYYFETFKTHLCVCCKVSEFSVYLIEQWHPNDWVGGVLDSGAVWIMCSFCSCCAIQVRSDACIRHTWDHYTALLNIKDCPPVCSPFMPKYYYSL